MKTADLIGAIVVIGSLLSPIIYRVMRMNALVERLRVFPLPGCRGPMHAKLRNAAADEIERLDAELNKWRAEYAKQKDLLILTAMARDQLAARLAKTEALLTTYREAIRAAQDVGMKITVAGDSDE